MADTERDRIVCPNCGEHLDLQSGGWAFVYTQILLHLDRCARDMSVHERHELARAAVPSRIL